MRRERKKSSKKEVALKISIAVVVFAFLASAAVYVVMLKLEKELLAGERQIAVWVLREQIQKNQIVKDIELANLVEQVLYPESLVPEKAYTIGQSLPAGRADCPLGKGTVLCDGMLSDIREEVQQYQKPVIATVEISDLTAAVSGILRKGDRINLYIYKEEEEVGRYEEVLVENVFDGNGTSIPGEETQPATRINVYLEREEAADFYRIQQNAVVRCVKLIKE